MNIEFWVKRTCLTCEAAQQVLDTRDVTITYRSLDDEPGLVDEAGARGVLSAPVVVTPDDA